MRKVRRAPLTWVGKRPLSHVTAFPAQCVEVHDALSIAGISRAEDDDKPNQPRQFLKMLGKQWNRDCWEDAPYYQAHVPEYGGQLFHGDNKEVLAHLLANGFRGKVNLIYIDPPFDSGADYVRKVSLRGPKGTAKLDGETYTLGEQIQYTDIWANDNYLQFMFERLMLLKELLAEDGTLCVHCDESKSHHLRCLLDEVFGADNFLNSVCWFFANKPQFSFVSYFPRDIQTIHIYAKKLGSHHFSHQYVANKRVRKQNVVVWDAEQKRRVSKRDEEGNVVYRDSTERLIGSMWDVPMVNPAGAERAEYPTQKPEELIERIVVASSRPGDLVLDCFLGSGTTAAVAQKLGRRWIGCDINKGAIQTTVKRLRGIVAEQIDAARKANGNGRQKQLLDAGDEHIDEPLNPAQFGFTTWRVNDYDLQIQHNEAVNLACEHIGVERTRSDSFFDGTRGQSLVKITPFGHPLTPLDLEELKRELESRPDEDRPVTVVCLGCELAAKSWIDDWNRLRKGKHAVNKIEVIELRTDPKYGRFLAHQPATARIKVTRKADQLLVEIQDFVSPTVLERLKGQANLLSPKIDDWRAMVDCLYIDAAYDAQVFNVGLADIPERKTDFVTGKYTLAAPSGETTVAVKLIDMLGEEVLVTFVA